LNHPEFEKGGYPTDNTLDAIEAWDALDQKGFWAFVKEAWTYDSYFTKVGTLITLHTGGWSGNESVVDAIQENHVMWALCWLSSRRGGHYEFTVKEGA